MKGPHCCDDGKELDVLKVLTASRQAALRRMRSNCVFFAWQLGHSARMFETSSAPPSQRGRVWSTSNVASNSPAQLSQRHFCPAAISRRKASGTGFRFRVGETRAKGWGVERAGGSFKLGKIFFK